ncbi:porin [Azohydromonas lata]|uniref:porin n=1 Tax=Azohydromonas lata TaxID=45677 RepID=UPI00082FD693|nr:porin [Azohydromonas lata]
MKTTACKQLLCACAATLLALPGAQAQSNVTISGTVDIGLYRDSHTRVTNVGPISRSYLTFSGTEDLGNGMTALFVLTTRFEPDTGTLENTNKPFFHGESTVGLKGSFGTIKLGRRLDAVNNLDWQFDPWYNFDRVASPAWDTWHYNFPSDPRGNGTSAAPSADYGRLNNGIFYDSPTFNGFAVHFSGSPEKVDGDKNRALGTALTYNGGNFSALGAHSKNSAGHTDNLIGAKVSFSPVTVMAVYNVSKTDTSKAKAFTAGVEYSLGATTLKGGYGQVDVDGVKQVKIVSGGAFYSLSKRTTVYGEIAHRKRPDDAFNTYGVGISHSF